MGFSRDARVDHVGDTRDDDHGGHFVILSPHHHAGAPIVARPVDYPARVCHRGCGLLFIGAGVIRFHRRAAQKQRAGFSR